MQSPCLDIIIPHYSEKPAQIRHLLDSIEMQVGVNLSTTIVVTIVNDKNDETLSDLMQWISTAQYSFPIGLIQNPKNSGAGVTRQLGIDMTKCPYIMFCDADDSLWDCSALNRMLSMIRLTEAKNKSWSYIWGNFVEERKNGKAYDLFVHNQPSVIWLHGKIWNRQFLEKYHIRFHPTLRTYEDTYFGKVVNYTAPNSIIHCDTSVYLWRHNLDSITSKWNHDSRDYLYWNNNDYITCTSAVLETLYPNWKSISKWKEITLTSLYITYFILQMPEYSDETPETTEKRAQMEQLFIDIIKNYGDTLIDLSVAVKSSFYNKTRYEVAQQFDFVMEQQPWNNFIQMMAIKYSIDTTFLQIPNESCRVLL